MEIPEELNKVYLDLIQQYGRNWRDLRTFLRGVCRPEALRECEEHWEKLEIIEQMISA